MRSILLTGAAALGLSLATAGVAQTPAPAASLTPAPAASVPATPDQAPPDQVAPPPTADAPAPAMAAPAAPRHHMHRASAGGENWAHQPGTGESGPASNKASNISAADTHSDIAPHLPQPAVGRSAGADSYLQAAQEALKSHHTGAAQQALEMAETRLLDRSTPAGEAGTTDQDAAVQQVANARAALGNGDTKGAGTAIQMALGGAGK